MTVTFTLRGKTLTGVLNPVSGGGQPMYHLIVDSYYYGYLIKVRDGWAFHSNQFPELKELADYFGGVVESSTC